jgi:hypothetical protein
LSMVRSITPYTYTITGAGASAGLMADTIPSEYTHTSQNGIHTIDYNAMFAHLWAAIQQLAGDVEEVRGTRMKRQANTTSSEPCLIAKTPSRRASI